jgi:uncharacterized protein YjbJ (UPF0337 family)
MHQRMTNWNMVEAQWNQMASQVKARWTKLSVADIEKIAGKRNLLVAKLQESYGIFQLEAENQVTSWATKLAKAAAAAAAPVEAAGTVDTATTPVAPEGAADIASPTASPDEPTEPRAPKAPAAVLASPEPIGN